MKVLDCRLQGLLYCVDCVGCPLTIPNWTRAQPVGVLGPGPSGWGGDPGPTSYEAYPKTLSCPK